MKAVQKSFYKLTDSSYTISFNKINVNILTGSVLMTDFSLKPDTAYYYTKKEKLSKNFYELYLDTLQINRVGILSLISKKKFLKVSKIAFIKPKFTVLGVVKNDSSKKVLKQKSVSYDTVKRDVIGSLFQVINKIRIKKIIIKDGNFDFLKPDISNKNSFTIKSITFIINNFYADKEMFYGKGKNFFSDDIEMIIDDYRLKLKDNIHVFGAKKLYINSKTKEIILSNIYLRPNKNIIELSDSNANILDFSIAKIKLDNADFKEIYLKHQLHLTKAYVAGLDGKIYSQKRKVKKKTKFNRDSIKSKIDVYHLFKGYLSLIQIDTLNVADGRFKTYANVLSGVPKTSIANFDLSINNFLIDSTSINDTNRVLYSKEMTMNLYGLKFLMKDSIHTLSATSAVVSIGEQGIYAKNIKIEPNQALRLYAKKRHANFNRFFISSINIAGFNFKKYEYENQIDIKQILVSRSNIDFKSYGKVKKEKPAQPFLQLLQNFIKKVEIRKIVVLQGKMRYRLETRDKNTYITSNYRASIRDFRFNPYSKKVTTLATVGSINAIFTKLIFNTSDSLYSLQADSLYYSTQRSKLLFTNVKLNPIRAGLYKRLQRLNKSMVFSIEIPRFSISNTNLSSAFEADSLGLKTVILKNPVFDLSFYPQIQQKNTKKKLINNIKRQAINKIIRASTKAEVKVYAQTPDLDSSTYVLFKLKRNAIDTIALEGTNAIIKLRIHINKLRDQDTAIKIISQLRAITVKNMAKIALDSMSKNRIKIALGDAIAQIKFLVDTYNAPKLNRKQIFHQIGLFLPQISSDSLIIENAVVKYNISNKNSEQNIFSADFDLSLYKFHFDSLDIDSTKKILFSDKFILTIRNTVFNLKDSIHQLKIRKCLFNSGDSVIIFDDLKIFPRRNDYSKIQMNITVPEIRLQSIDLGQLYFSNKFKAGKFVFIEPKINIILPQIAAQREQKNPINKIFLPDKLSELSIKNISFEKGEINIKKQKSNLSFSSDFNISLFNFLVDSLTSVSENKYFIPINNFDINFKNIKYLSADSSAELALSALHIASKNGLIRIDSFSYANYTCDSSKIYEYVKQKNRMSLFVNSLEISRFDFGDFRFNKRIVFGAMQIDTPELSMYNLKHKKTKKFDLSEINIYDRIKSNIQKILAKELIVNDIFVKTSSYTDSSVERKEYKDISLKLTGIRIDSTTFIDRPNLFYCDDFSFELKNLETLSKNKIYKIKLARLTGSTKQKSLSGYDLEYVPTVPLEQVQKYFKWRTTAMSVKVKTISLRSLDFYDVIFQKKIKARILRLDSMQMQTYTDRNVEHNENQVKPHLIEKIFEIPFLVDIRLAVLSNVDIFYKEIEPKTRKTARIKYGDATIKIINITNDTVQIRKKDIYTIIKSEGYINDTAKVTFNVYYQLLSRGDFAKVQGEIGECKASVFNSYTQNGVNLLMGKGVFHRIAFDFKIKDTIAIGKMHMEYNNLKVFLLSKDTIRQKKKKLLSWLADVLLLRNNNPRYGIYPKLGIIAYIHDNSYSDIKLWIKSILSGVQSTIAFNPKDVKKIRKIMRKNKRKVEQAVK